MSSSMSPAPAFSEVEVLDKAKSPLGTYELPNGLVDDQGVIHKILLVRELTGEEEDILANSKMPSGRRIDLLIKRCILSIGTIKASDPKWDKYYSSMSSVDRYYCLFAIRSISLGQAYDFEVDCPCEKKTKMHASVDLLKDIEITPMPDPSLVLYNVDLPSGKKAVMKIQTAVEEEEAERISTSQDIISTGLLVRMLSLDGSSPVTMTEVKALSIKDRRAIRKAMEAAEGGVDMTLQVTCKRCGIEFDSPMSLADPSFFGLRD